MSKYNLLQAETMFSIRNLYTQFVVKNN